MNDVTKKYLVIGSVVVILAAIAIYWRQNKKTAVPEGYTSATGQQNQNASNSSASSTTSSSKNPNLLAYGKAVDKYPFRIQFNQCHAFFNLPSVGTMEVAKGVTIMLDNRDNAAHTFSLLGHSYRVAAYGYALVNASAKGDYNISCDGGGYFALKID